MTAWLAYQLVSRDLSTVQIFLNRLPGRYARPEGDTVSWESWGEVEPLLWGRLDQELRILENGRLRSVSADYYDSRIQAEIDRQPTEFPEAQVIGSLIGHGLRMPDTWIADRIEVLIRSGRLTVAEEQTPGVPSYRRTLRKTAV